MKIAKWWANFWHPDIVIYNMSKNNHLFKNGYKYTITIAAKMETSGEIKNIDVTKSEALYIIVRLSLAVFGFAR